jgi:hypothetical protein
MNISIIPSAYYVPAQYLVGLGFSYSELKHASLHGGVLERYRSKKTRRIFYKSKNMSLF